MCESKNTLKHQTIKCINAPFSLTIGDRGKKIIFTGVLILVWPLALLSFRYLKNYTPEQHLAVVPALSKVLDKTKFTMSSTVSIDLEPNIVRLPCCNGPTVWYIRTDISNAQIAKQLGLNVSPRLANAGMGCLFCIQLVI